ncbi:AhpC/TSA family protein [Mucilaginibacter robiniae]|uniref:AhpC/TSA family protein n=1 Tax=Mucilaginibacter robiniae TaxID=2728022 RepID=A0A7L5E2N2_9SPHI|nr:TlpA disulfide reductase family protein [Mucilaginibacter robiniae]QJD97395.1 AhpC/TSA family protein [Mucilaginibacter robiniae]
MKKLILTALATVPALAFAQTGKFTVKGKLGSNITAPAKAYLQYRKDGQTIMDSAVVNKGTFEFTGATSTAPMQAYVLLNQAGNGMARVRDYQSIYLENGTINITSKDSLKNAEVTGTPTNMDNEAFSKANKPVQDIYTAMEAKQKAATPEQRNSAAFKAEMEAMDASADEQSNKIGLAFIKAHPKSIISLNQLRNLAYGEDYNAIAPLYNSLSPDLKNSESGKKFGEQLAGMKNVALGATATDFALADTSGKMVKLSSFRGKYLLVDLWASWCGPCRAENPHVVEAYNKYKTKNFTILGVSLDRPNAKDKWLAAIHKDGLAWTQVSDLKFWDSEVAHLYGVQAIPQNFLLDPNGKVIAKNLRGAKLDAKLAEIFSKGETAKAEE